MSEQHDRKDSVPAPILEIPERPHVEVYHSAADGLLVVREHRPYDEDAVIALPRGDWGRIARAILDELAELGEDA